MEERRKRERRRGVIDRRRGGRPTHFLIPTPYLATQAAALSVLYIIAVMIATGISGAFGPTASVVTSFFGIGFALIVRDRLHDLWNPRPWEKMIALICAGSLGSLLVNLSHPEVALASFLAFASAESADAATYYFARRTKWYVRVTASNITFAGWDSVIFASIAFGGFNLVVVAAQFLAKIVGSSLYLWFFRNRFIAYDRRAAVLHPPAA